MKTHAIRLVQETDSDAILRIYEPYVKETAITFEYETPSSDAFKARIKSITTDYPYIVCIINEKIVGYAYAHKHRERAAYQWNAELSVYMEKSHQRCGIGKVLYSALIEILKLQNIKNIYGAVTFPNAGSERFHDYFGFKKLGVYHNTGFKFEAWHDVMLFEKAIGDYNLEPKPFVPIKEIDRAVILEILNTHSKMLK